MRFFLTLRFTLGADVSATIMRSGIPKPQINANDRRCKIPLPRIIHQKMHPTFELFGCSGLSENSGRLMENIVLLELKRDRNEYPALEIYYHKKGEEVDFRKSWK